MPTSGMEKCVPLEYVDYFLEYILSYLSYKKKYNLFNVLDSDTISDIIKMIKDVLWFM